MLYQTIPQVESLLMEQLADVTSRINGMFDQAIYAGLGDEEYFQPRLVDLSGTITSVPYSITLSRGKSVGEAVYQAMEQANQGLLPEMYALSSQLRVLAGGSRIEWHAPLKVEFVLPPSLSDMVRWRGQASGFNFAEHIEDPAVLVWGQVVCRGAVKS